MSRPISATAREREFVKYYGHHAQNFPMDGQPSTTHDSVLTALAQVAALRLDARRAIVVLTNRNRQYILAEATRTISLRSDAVFEPGDALRWGPMAVSRDALLCDQFTTLRQSDQISQSPVHFCCTDLTSDARFQKHALVCGPKPSRFYASVPIYSAKSIELGYLAVMDEKPKNRLDGVAIAFMSDLAEAIRLHLEGDRLKDQHRRGGRMVRGLGSFVEGQATIDHGRTGADRDCREGSRPVYEKEGQLNVRQQQVLEDQRNRGQSWNQDDGDPSANGATSPHELPDFSKAASVVVDSPTSQAGRAGRTVKADSVDELLLAPMVGETFSRAANIIRESIEVEGALFFDANITSFGGFDRQRVKRDDEEASDSHPTFSSSDDHTQASYDESSTDEVKLCTVLGFSTSDLSSINNDAPHHPHLTLPEKQLKSLLRRYARGKVFNFDEHGAMSSGDSSDDGLQSIARTELGVTQTSDSMAAKHRDRLARRQTDADAIIKIFPGARSLALLPVWDSHRERWFAGLIVWSKSPTRILTVEGEMSYLSAFSNSLMAEVARLDFKLKDQSKTRLISSISHELRSPLHGILGSVEFLQENAWASRDAFERNMIYAIETCGKTLLDTVDHLLDYAKVDNFVKTSKDIRQKRRTRRATKDAPSRALAVGGTMSLTSHFDLGQITEEVIEAVFAGHQRQVTASADVHASESNMRANDVSTSQISRDVYGDGQTGQSNVVDSGRVTIVVDIEKTTDLVFNTQAGAWRRILMNIFGNALKYTRTGFIKIHLKTQPSNPQHGAKRSNIILSVTDSGRGMSKHYLQNGLFRTWAQEESLDPGTGLGLSIVRTIVIALDGQIRVHSVQGIGTEITVSVPLWHSRPPQPTKTSSSSSLDLESRYRGATVRFVGFARDNLKPDYGLESVDVTANGLAAFQASLEHIFQDHLQMRITTDTAAGDPDVYITRQGSFSAESGNNKLPGNVSIPWIVICKDPASAFKCSQEDKLAGVTRVVEYISQPCGPIKISRILRSCFDRSAAQETADNAEQGPDMKEQPREDDGSKSDQELSGGAQALTPQPENLYPAYSSRSRRTSSVSTVAEPRVIAIRPTLSSAVTSYHAGALKILLVDDNLINLQLLRAFVKKSKLPHETAANGLEALEAFKSMEGGFDVVLMDISMPVMDGLQSTRAIREHERATQAARPATIIALTAFASAAVQQEAFASGANMFLAKPIRFSELSEILADVDENKHKHNV